MSKDEKVIAIDTPRGRLAMAIRALAEVQGADAVEIERDVKDTSPTLEMAYIPDDGEFSVAPKSKRSVKRMQKKHKRQRKLFRV